MPAATVHDRPECWAIDGLYLGATPIPRDRPLMPLYRFPDDKRFIIGLAVLAPSPPPKWISLGPAQITSRAWHEWHWYRHSDTRRSPLPLAMRLQVIERDGLVCGLCGGGVEEDDIHIDHIIPVSKGGKDMLDNLQVSHSTCNLRKGNRVG